MSAPENYLALVGKTNVYRVDDSMDAVADLDDMERCNIWRLAEMGHRLMLRTDDEDQKYYAVYEMVA